MLVVPMSKLRSEAKEILETFESGRLKRVKHAEKESRSIVLSRKKLSKKLFASISVYHPGIFEHFKYVQ